MTPQEWKKVERFVTKGTSDLNRTACPVCGETITKTSDYMHLIYTKTRGGTHLFIHERCIKPQGGKNARKNSK